ncbi:OprD family outer membrane porin [Sulfurospirillum sp.]|uniref:OprD family outer membrane porin n=1 Tax=Sulfurospirillum sp. TaxID=2053622 RepID=UPI002FDEB1C6
MKLAKLSLAAIVVAGLASSSFAADTLADAFKNGSVNGELKAYYFSKDDGSKTEDLFTTGVTLGYKTASFYGLSLGLTFQGNSSPFADGAVNDTPALRTGGKGMFQGSEYGTGAQLSEAYLAYNIGKTTAMVGRMFLDTPLVASSGSRMTKDSFEGAAIINTDLPNTTLIAGYVQKGQDRTDGKGSIGKFTKTFATGSADPVPADDGAFTLAAINKSITGLTLTAAYAYANDLIQISYAEVLYEGKVGAVGYNLAGQYYYNKFDNAIVSPGEDDSINAYGLKAGASFKGINGYVAYSKVSNDNVATGAVISGLGNGADLLYTNPVINGANYGADVEAYAADLNYDITSAANVGARYVETKDKSAAITEKVSFTSVYGYYKFDGALKGLKLGVEYEDLGKDKDGNDLWVKAGYKF